MKLCLVCGHCFRGEDWRCPQCHYDPQVFMGYRAFALNDGSVAPSFDVASFGRLAEVEARNFWFRSRNRLLCWALQRYFPEAQNLLELGCGTGFVLSEIERQFPKLSLTGGDIFVQGLQIAERRVPGARVLQLDARQIPFSEEFDVIGAFDVLEHINEDESVLSQIFRATKPGGGIMLTVPQHPSLWSAQDERACHKRRYTKRQLIDRVQRTGFEVIRVTSFVSLLLPLMWISRLRQRGAGPKRNAMTELKISGSLNALLESILTFERGFIKFGVSFPAGGSLLVVARRN